MLYRVLVSRNSTLFYDNGSQPGVWNPKRGPKKNLRGHQMIENIFFIFIFMTFPCIFTRIGKDSKSTIWTRVKYLNNDWLDCHKIWYRHLWSPEDKSY